MTTGSAGKSPVKDTDTAPVELEVVLPASYAVPSDKV